MDKRMSSPSSKVSPMIFKAISLVLIPPAVSLSRTLLLKDIEATAEVKAVLPNVPTTTTTSSTARTGTRPRATRRAWRARPRPPGPSPSSAIPSSPRTMRSADRATARWSGVPAASGSTCTTPGSPVASAGRPAAWRWSIASPGATAGRAWTPARTRAPSRCPDQDRGSRRTKRAPPSSEGRAATWPPRGASWRS